MHPNRRSCVHQQRRVRRHAANSDSYYASYFLLCALRERGVEAVFEQQGARRLRTNFRCGQWLGQHDHLITIAKPKIKPDWMAQADYDGAPATLTVRELRTDGKLLVTTLLYPKHTPKAARKNNNRVPARVVLSRWQEKQQRNDEQDPDEHHGGTFLVGPPQSAPFAP